jgi:hypothetical protein
MSDFEFHDINNNSLFVGKNKYGRIFSLTAEIFVILICDYI